MKNPTLTLTRVYENILPPPLESVESVLAARKVFDCDPIGSHYYLRLDFEYLPSCHSNGLARLWKTSAVSDFRAQLDLPK